MNKQSTKVLAVLLALSITACTITCVLAWWYATQAQLASYEIAALNIQLQNEQTAHHVDVVRLSNEIEELNVELSIVREENLALGKRIQMLEALVEELPDEVINLTDADKEALLRVAMSEAGNQGVIGKALVMCVVLNRVAHPTKFADTAEEVILSGAFNVTAPGGGYWTCVPDWECEAALYMVTHGWNESNGVLYFTSAGYSPYGDPEKAFQYRDHYFN